MVNGQTVINMANAVVINSNGLNLIDLNDEVFTGYIASNGDLIKILEIFEGKLLVLVSHDENAEDWIIGYFNLDNLVTNIMIRKNTIEWDNALVKTVVNSNKEIIYQLPATQIIQFLYETPLNNYACILFNDSLGNLMTGYVAMCNGIFYRYAELPSQKYPNSPQIKDNTSNAIDTTSTKFYQQIGNIIKVGDLTLNINNLNVLNEKNNTIYTAGFSSNLVSFVKLREGFSSTAYLDSTGHWTIGYGHLITGTDGYTSNSTITEDDAETLLINELTSLCNELKKQININFSNFKFSNTNQLDAVLDLAYNNGLIVVSNQLEHSIFKDIENNQLENLQFDFCEWCHGGINGIERPIFGLYKRKLEDFIIFTTGLYISLNEMNLEQLENSLKFKSNFNENIWY